MPIFQYRGYRTDGSEVAGTIEANSQKDAVLRLQESGLYPKKVRETVYHGKTGLFRRTDANFLPSVTRQLSTLLSSGVTLMEALSALADENTGFWKNLLVTIKEKVAAGASFSKALEECDHIFPEFYVNMVAAGETSGTLDKVLGRLADFLETQTSLKSKVQTSMIYPVFMICVGFIVLSFLFTFVIPKITKIFKDTESALPLLTVVLIAISDIFQHYWWLLIGLLLSGIFGFRRLKEKNRLLIDRMIVRLPGKIMQSLYFARFTRTLGFLLEGGLPVLRALELSGKSIGNTMLRNRVIEAAQRVAEGARLSASLEGFPPVLLQLISTGERSGQLVGILKNAADSYEEEFSRRVQQTLAFLEPAMILIMGFIVGLIVLAVLLPIFQLNQLIK
ncbi:MAG TPA: type II secretion system F family protein [Thermodesulfovibrionales bacterium]|jgi:general secretion pathway protein F|nr:type II secretion system F family protein [Thermodesulfovibrionales bacterium]